MFTVKTPEEVFSLLDSEFHLSVSEETVPLDECPGRILASDIIAEEYVPGFSRSTVDGYAVRASDTFGCSDAIPAMLVQTGEILMGETAGGSLSPDTCMAVPTGGALPEGADAAVMIEYTEAYGDGTIGIMKPAAPGMNIIHKGEDISPGKTVLAAGRKLTSSDAGALAALGIMQVPVRKKPVIGIISTGDELVPADETPGPGQIRDVNSHILTALCLEMGAVPRGYGIVKDEKELLAQVLGTAVSECDIVLISGGSSVGARDAACDVIEQHGEILFHGIAMKPGKPTILGNIAGKPVFGLPGHPVAAYFITRLFVSAAADRLTGAARTVHTTPAVLTEAVSTNHGRAEALGVRLSGTGKTLSASPVHTKSGLISALAGTDGYILIPRDCEGLPEGAAVDVILF